MKYHIENELFKVEVQEQGAELCSIRSLKTNREYIWQPNPDIWNSSAPVLFPIIGGLKDGAYEFDGNTYNLPKHGLVRNSNAVKLINRTKSRLSFLFSHTDDTLAQYPFKFDFKISFFLVENKLQVFHEVVNLNNTPMHFSVGGHPAFKCPWIEEENYDDYYLEFERTESANIHEVRAGGLISEGSYPMLDNTNKLPLSHELFERDAKVFTELNSSEVTLKSKTNKSSIKVDFEDFPFLGIWAKPDGDFVCIEPWNGLPDFENSDKDFKKKHGNVNLAPGNTHYASYTIQILEV